MKKYLSAVLLALFISQAYSQNNLSLGLGVDFSFATKGLGLNETGFGVYLQGNLFALSSLQLHIETGLDRFIGDKLLAVDANDIPYERNPTIKRFLAGPEFFMSKKISVGALYGLVWSNWYNNKRTQDGVKLFLSGYLGKRGLISSLSFTTLPGSGVYYASAGLGYLFIRSNR